MYDHEHVVLSMRWQHYEEEKSCRRKGGFATSLMPPGDRKKCTSFEKKINNGASNTFSWKCPSERPLHWHLYLSNSSRFIHTYPKAKEGANSDVFGTMLSVRLPTGILTTDYLTGLGSVKLLPEITLRPEHCLRTWCTRVTMGGSNKRWPKKATMDNDGNDDGKNNRNATNKVTTVTWVEEQRSSVQ